jgi:hypothetical protein
MKYFIIVALLLLAPQAQANDSCEAYGLLAESVMEFRQQGASLEMTQFIVNDRIAFAELSPDVEFAISMLPEKAFQFPTTNLQDFHQFVYDECNQ